MEDQLAAVERTSKERGHDYTDLALRHRRPALRARAGHHDRRRVPLLRHAQAQIHHRGHAGPHSVHPQHGHRHLDRATRDRARRRPPRLLEQSRRHAFLASLLGVQHIVLAVNKMDLVDWDQERFEKIRDEFHAFAVAAQRA